MTFSRFRKFFIFLTGMWAYGIIAAPLSPIEKKYSPLFSSPLRPSIDLFFESFHNDFSQPNPFPEDPAKFSTDYRKFFSTDGPQLIAQIEGTFPGASIATLGRDADLVGDFLEAFYKSHGINRKVIRIRASTSTLIDSSPKNLMKYLRQLGLDYSNPEKVKRMPPLLILDRTYFREQSQSRVILATLYQDYARKGDPIDLVRKLNVISLLTAVNPTAIAYPLNQASIEESFLKQEEQIKFLREQQKSANDHSTLLAPLECFQIVTQHPLTDSTPWTDSYDKVIATPSRKIFSSLHSTPESDSLLVLKEMYDVIKVAKARHMLTKAKRILFQNFGRKSFQDSPEFLVTKKNISIDKELKIIRDRIPGLKPDNPFRHNEYLAPTAEKFELWYTGLASATAENREDNILLKSKFISLLYQAFKSEKIEATDFAFLITTILNLRYQKEDLRVFAKALQSSLSPSDLTDLLKSLYLENTEEYTEAKRNAQTITRLLKNSCSWTFDI